ncbi:hypothetical protein ABXV03_06375 [Streptomyces harbinensis]|uniref:hypothetical protein n=1 Tax=Streptomyces harbinensis TaxID=1176198 RepID=UPI0033995519
MTTTAESVTLDRLTALLSDESIDIAHRALWQLLWESEVRVMDLLSLEVPDIDLGSRRIRPEAASRAAALPDGGDIPISERAATLLTAAIGDRTSGPLFAAGPRALTWEEATRAAVEHGCAIHAFRIGGKRHRATV